jgi:hypothetical protein
LSEEGAYEESIRSAVRAGLGEQCGKFGHGAFRVSRSVDLDALHAGRNFGAGNGRRGESEQGACSHPGHRQPFRCSQESHSRVGPVSRDYRFADVWNVVAGGAGAVLDETYRRSTCRIPPRHGCGTEYSRRSPSASGSAVHVDG